MVERRDDPRVTAWAIAAGQGDRDALTRFVRATQHDVHRYVSHLSSPREADDLTQDTYLRALRALPRFAGRSPARIWLLSIARHTVADAVRHSVRRPRARGVEDWDVLAAVTGHPKLRTAADESVLLHRLVAALDPDRREAFVLTQLLGLSYDEAAGTCGCPVGTIRSRVARAREDLVEAMSTGSRSQRGTGPA